MIFLSTVRDLVGNFVDNTTVMVKYLLMHFASVRERQYVIKGWC